MQKTKIFTSFIFSLLFVIACDDLTDVNVDTLPPNPPSGLRVYAYNETVELYWRPNTEDDLDHYNVYVSNSYDGVYNLLGSVREEFFRDVYVRNGETYYYAITAVDYNWNESELSYDVAFGIPRPDGFNVLLYNYRVLPEESGYSFASENRVAYNSMAADFFFEVFEGEYFIDVWADTDIIDVGATASIYDVTVAPSTGWVPINEGENIKYVEAIPGHTYVIWTSDNHYGKIRISSVSSDRMTFDWAYQLVEGAPQLKKISREKLERKQVERKN